MKPKLLCKQSNTYTHLHTYALTHLRTYTLRHLRTYTLTLILYPYSIQEKASSYRSELFFACRPAVGSAAWYGKEPRPDAAADAAANRAAKENAISYESMAAIGKEFKIRALSVLHVVL